MAELEKIQKVLSRAGLASRREIERWIEQGRVSINGQPAQLGARVGEQDKLKVDGKLISRKRLNQSPVRVLIYNKPIGEICTRSDPQKRATVFDQLPKLSQGRWIVVGRLDINTSGLLLFTTDGELANKLMHPSSEMDREYAVRVMGQVESDALVRMKGGVMLDDGLAKFTDITAVKNKKEDAINQWYYCSLVEGRNREVRRLWESQGYKVSRLKRVRFGPVHLLAKVKEGQHYEMNEKEVRALYRETGLKAPAKVSAGSTKQRRGKAPDRPRKRRKTKANSKSKAKKR